MARARVEIEEIEDDRPSGFLPTGSGVLDLALGGGWAQNRIINIVGDKSTGKTLQAIEACAQFAAIYGKDDIRYCEAEAAFDEEYAESIGMPEGIDYERTIDTVEKWFEDLTAWLKKNKTNKPCLYILDSLDALSDEAEMEREIDKGSYGGSKAKKLSELFRRLVRELRTTNCTLIIISQIRDKIGVMFGETKTRSGGRALDFYCSQIVWLSEIGKTKVTVRGIARVTGLEVKARVRKNKVGLAHREVEFLVRFGYGVDDEVSMINWLRDCKEFDKEEYQNAIAQVDTMRHGKNRAGLRALNKELFAACKRTWDDIETQIATPMRKYDG